MFDSLKKLFSKSSPVELTPIPAEHKEKAWEYQQVAGLLCMDIDLLDKCVDESMSKEEIIWQVRDLVEKKNDMITNKESRDDRYSAAAFLVFLTGGKHGS